MAGTGCYWGFETRGNRIAWGLVVLFVLVGTAFWIPGVIEVKKCINTYNRCLCQVNGGTVQCLDPRVPTEQPRVKACYDSYAACMRKPAAVWSVGWVFLVLLSWLPRCYFCCCSRNPKSAAAGTAYGLQMAPMVGGPAMMGSPSPGQPYSSGAYGYAPAYPAAPPATAYPAGPGGGPMQQQQQQMGGYPPNSSGTYGPPQQPYDSNVPVHRY